ncbi:NAD-dependent succinate-semialdehyde dehydrogenase [Pseudomonas putida]
MGETTINALAAPAVQQWLFTQAFVAGQWVEGSEHTDVIDPATGVVIARVTACDAGVMNQAIEAAQQAFGPWRAMLAQERSHLLRRWAALVREHCEALAIILSAEQGKPVAESKGELAYGAAFLDWFAEEGQRAYGDTIPTHKAASRLYVTRHPIGITAAITPWNFPMAMIARKAGAALAAGCPMIVKPAPETPLSALALARLAQLAGIPSGVLQVVTGDPITLSKALNDDVRVRALSFTGSTEVGRILLHQASDSIKKVSMELGGHAPFIVFADAPLDDAIEGCLAAKFATSGQDCLAANRIYVQAAIYHEFCQRYAARVAQLRVGHGLDPHTDIGPMTRLSVADKCRAHINDAVAKGARLLTGAAHANEGRFVTPTVLADVTEHMLIAQEETFGPVAALLRFEDEAEVVTRANASEMGLAAYVYTQNLNRAMRVSDALEYGMVGVNTASFTGAPIPFGGWKASGLGREGSRHGLDEFMELKYTCFGNLNA